MTPHSTHLLTLGRRILAHYARLPGVACAAITGSSAEGKSDQFSDLDTTIYYHQFPPEADIRAVRTELRGGPLILNIGSPADGEFLESFRVDGIDCQFGHTTIAKWEADIDQVLGGTDIGSPLNKAMSGTLISIAVTGDNYLEKWKARIRAYPDSLAIAAANHYLKFFAVWGVINRLEIRDGPLWIRQSFLDASFNILGALAAVNRTYFTTFQFKRQRAFIDALAIKPPHLADRLDQLWSVPLREGTTILRSLVADTTDLVEKHLPTANTAPARKALNREDPAWTLPT